MTKKKLKYLIPMILLGAKLCFGYIDPGTTGMIIGGSIWPFILGIFVAIGGFFVKYFKLIKRGLMRLWQKIKRKD